MDSLARDHKWQPRFRQLQLRGVRGVRQHTIAFLVREISIAQTDHDLFERMARGDLCMAPLVDVLSDALLAMRHATFRVRSEAVRAATD